MSFGGYGGPPADPFGGQQFGGGWGGPPPTYQAPPPQQSETNPLATLSIIFAFVFAPVGAALGHIALSQIKRLHQRGRDRAIIGLVLSYLIIVVLVAVLVVWRMLPSVGSANSTALAGYLLTRDDASTVFGGTFRQDQGPVTGGRGKMADLASDPSPPECASTLQLALRSSYEHHAVKGFALGSWDGEGGTTSAVADAVIELSSVDEAHSAFDEFRQLWHQCAGQSVTLADADAEGISRYDVTASSTTGNVVVAHLKSTSSSAGRITRAIGVHRNFLVEMDCSNWIDSADASELEQQTIDAVNTIVSKIGNG